MSFVEITLRLNNNIIMKQSVIKEMATNELEALLETEKARLEKMKVNHMVSPLENPKQITFTRKTVARINTELRSRKLIEAQN